MQFRWKTPMSLSNHLSELNMLQSLLLRKCRFCFLSNRPENRKSWISGGQNPGRYWPAGLLIAPPASSSRTWNDVTAQARSVGWKRARLLTVPNLSARSANSLTICTNLSTAPAACWKWGKCTCRRLGQVAFADHVHLLNWIYYCEKQL